MERLEMVAEGFARLGKPCKNPGIALIKRPCWRAYAQASDNLIDQLLLALGRKGRYDFLIIEDPSRDECLLAALAVRPQCIEVRQVRNRVHKAAGLVAAPPEYGRDDRQQKEGGRDFKRDQVVLRNRGTGDYGDGCKREDRTLLTTVPTRQRGGAKTERDQ